MTGLTAEAAVERVQSDTRARMLRATDPYLRERLHDLDELVEPADAPAARPGLRAAARPAAGERGHRRALDGAGGAARIRPQAPARPGAGGRRAQLARRDRRARARHSPRSARSPMPPASPIRAMPIIVDGATGDVHVRPSPDMEAAYVERVRLRARRQLQYLALRDKPCVTKDGEHDHADAQCRPRGRPAAYRGDRRRRHRPVPHRTAVHGGGDVAAHRRAVLALSRRARCRRRQAGDLPHPRYRRRQGAALYAQRGGGEPGARLARDPARPRPARPAAQPDPRAAAGGAAGASSS